MHNGKTIAAFVVVLFASFAIMNVLPPDGLPQTCLQEAVLAVVAVVAVLLSCPVALRSGHTGKASQRALAARDVVPVLLVGLVGGMIWLIVWCFASTWLPGAVAPPVEADAVGAICNLALLLAICLFTGIYEESLCRVLCLQAVEDALRENGDPPFKAERRAVLVSALLFALLHVGAPDVSAGQAVFAQSALKFVQALLFGGIMGLVYVRARRLLPCALLHGGFDALYLGPAVLVDGALPATYASGALFDTVVLSITLVMLAAIFFKMRKKMRI